MQIEAKLSCERKCVLIIYNVYLWVDLCLFIGAWLFAVYSKFMQEKKTTFLFSFYRVLAIRVNGQPNAYF